MASKNPPQQTGRLRAAVFVAVLVLVTACVVLLWFATRVPAVPSQGLSTVEADIKSGNVRRADIADSARTVTITPDNGPTYEATFPVGYGVGLTDRLLASGATVEAASPPSSFTDRLYMLLPVLLILPILFILMRKGGLMGGFLKVRDGRSTAVSRPDVTFADVAGCDEVVDELREIVDYLSDDSVFRRLGARVPRGVLLSGPPGCGKTLLARAVAGEAHVPFLAISGSDFVEMFAGVGASRMRRLFSDARKARRAVIFIDEIDAVGKARMSSITNGASEERENTLNQLLVELDGFEQDVAVFVLAATNRPDTLDPALLRAGRFDRKIEVPLPDRSGRSAILAVHARDLPVAGDVDLDDIARRTAGMTGSDLANILNQAALHGARRHHDKIQIEDVFGAIETVTLGSERRSRVMTERDRAIAAWHEAGHTVCALVQEDVEDPIQVSIVPRGRAGGATWVPASDDELVSRAQARARLVVLLGGRAAEELFLDGDMTHGAADDLKKATALARSLVAEFGMSTLGLSVLDEADVQFGAYGKDVHDAVETELGTAMDIARHFIREYATLVRSISQRLLERETVHAAALQDLAAPFLEAAAALRNTLRTQ